MTARNSTRVLGLIIFLIFIDVIGGVYWMVVVDTTGQRIFVLAACFTILLALWVAVGEVVKRTTLGASDLPYAKK